MDQEYESVAGEGRLTVTFELELPPALAPDAVLYAVESQPGVAYVRYSATG
jgi:hypothetical protein